MEACFKNDGRIARLKTTPRLVSALSVEPEKKKKKGEQVSSCLKEEMNLAQ